MKNQPERLGESDSLFGRFEPGEQEKRDNVWRYESCAGVLRTAA